MFIWLCTGLDALLIFNEVLLKLPLIGAVWPNHLCSSKQVLATWEPTTPISYDSIHISPAIAQHFLFGSPWADEFALWLQKLKWIQKVMTPWIEVLVPRGSSLG